MNKRSRQTSGKTTPPKEPKGRARRILELENPAPSQAEDMGFQELIEVEANKAGLTADEWHEAHWPPLYQRPWDGGRERDKPGKEEELEALAANGLTAHDPLELFFIAIRRSLHPDEKRGDLEAAVQRAKHQLTGTPLPSGRPPTSDCEEVCMAIAPDYFARSVGLRQADKHQTLAALLKAQKGLVDTTDIKDANDKAIRPYERYFEAHKDRLMARVSDGKYEDLGRKANFLKVLELLRECGVEVDIAFIQDNWDSL